VGRVKRTTLARVTPLKARKGLSRKTPLRAAGIGRASENRAAREPGKTGLKRPRRQTGFSPAVRKSVRVRAGDRCEACGIWLPPGYGQIQHRLARKAGGRHGGMRVLASSIQNAALLCGTSVSGCHGLAESRDVHMHGMGFWLEEGENPELVPVMLHGEYGGVTVWLTGAGGYSTAAPEGAAA
jgi:hypothetical protein